MPRPKKKTYLDDVISRLGAKVDTVALAQSLIDEFGGPQGLAKYIARCIKNSDSPTVQAQLLRSAIGLMTTASEKTNLEDELGGLSMEDLQAAVSEIEIPEDTEESDD